MQIVISPSDKPSKKFEARIDGKNQYTSVLNNRFTKTLPYIKTLRGKRDISNATLKTKTGIIP